MKALELLETDSDVFRYVSNHLLRQNHKCQEKDMLDCLYKSESDDGLMCAVGCLISDINYNFGLEYKNVDDPLILEALGKSMPKWNINIKMLTRLQNVHDTTSVEEWEYYLDELDSIYGKDTEVKSHDNGIINQSDEGYNEYWHKQNQESK